MVKVELLDNVGTHAKGEILDCTKQTAKDIVKLKQGRYIEEKEKKINYYSKVNKPEENVKITIPEVFNIIKSDLYKESVEKLNEIKSDDEQRKYKAENFSAVTFAGSFKHRANANLEMPSGFSIVDIDDYEKGNEIKEEIKKDKFVYATWLSPRKGVKVLVKIPIVKDDGEYKIVYDQLLEHYKKFSPSTDSGTKDISRCSFLSYDSEIYINEGAEEFKVDWNKKPTSVKLPPEKIKEMFTGKTKAGNRHHSIISLAGKWKREGIPFEGAVASALTFNKNNCDPPKNESEVIKNVEEIYKRYENKKEIIDGKKENEFLGQGRCWGFEIQKNGKQKFWMDYQACANDLINELNLKKIGLEKPKLLFYKEGIYREGGENEVGEILQEHIPSIKNNHFNEIIGAVKRNLVEASQEFQNKDKNLICVRNGVLNTSTLELLPHSPKHLFMKMIPWDYKPSADCPKIKKFIDEVIEERDKETVQEWFGYYLEEGYPYKKALICVGEGNTGKTSFININTKFVDEKNCSSLSLHKILSDKFASASMQNKLMNFYDDLSFADIKNTGAFKIATGDGWVSAEKKFGESFQFKNSAKLLFATNKISNVEDSDDGAYYSRWLIFCFNNIFEGEKRKINLYNEITTEDEMSGLLNYALEGLQRLRSNGCFTNERSAEENKMIMELSSSSVSSFVADCLLEEPNYWISKEDMYNLYSFYVTEKGYARLSKEAFGRRFMKKCNYVTEGRRDCQNKKSVHGWSNVKLNTSNTPFKNILINKKYNILYYSLDKKILDIRLNNRGISSIQDSLNDSNTNNTSFVEEDIK